MAITLGTNIPSLNAQNSLNKSTNKLTDTMTRLSSGLKINRAGDDAAGLVISENMNALIRGSKQAMQNIQTAKNFLTVAEDGMVSIGDHLQRANDLLVNMANETNDVSSNTAAVQEIIERLNEINRLSETINFNGKNMLDGTTDEIIVQLGPDSSAGSILDISRALTDCHTKAFGIDLPGNLNPEAKIDKGNGNKVVVPVSKLLDDGTTETKYYYEGTDTEVQKDDYEKLTDSAFDPTNENCRKYMQKIQDAINTITTRRGYLGAYENRMDSSYDSLTIRVESLESAKSVYTDTDIASEATNMTQNQILQQINVAILANANTLPQAALSLIGG